VGNRQRKLQRLTNPPPGQKQKSKEQEVRELSERFRERSEKHFQAMKAEHGEAWEKAVKDARAEWKHQQELHGENSDQAIKAAQRASLLWRTGKPTPQ
jgi:hypothetical protein